MLLSRGKSLLRLGDHAHAQADLLEALQRAELEGIRQLQLDAHAALADAYKAAGAFESALTHAEARFDLNQQLFNEGTDLRIRTLQIAHDTERARQQAEIYRLRTTELEGMVQDRTRRLEAFQIEALTRLAVLGEFRDTDTGEHTVRVGDMAARLARILGLDEDWVERLRLAARLHDIGKVGIPDTILLKPGPLTPAEFEIMKTHTTIGASILTGSESPLVQMAEEVALNHHERWDGTGYPNGQAAEDIPLTGAHHRRGRRVRRPHQRASVQEGLAGGGGGALHPPGVGHAVRSHDRRRLPAHRRPGVPAAALRRRAGSGAGADRRRGRPQALVP